MTFASKSRDGARRGRGSPKGASPSRPAAGYFTGGDALQMIEAGATLVRYFTAFIYRGWNTAPRSRPKCCIDGRTRHRRVTETALTIILAWFVLERNAQWCSGRQQRWVFVCDEEHYTRSVERRQSDIRIQNVSRPTSPARRRPCPVERLAFDQKRRVHQPARSERLWQKHTVKLVAGLDVASTGTLSFTGQAIVGPPAGLGMVFQKDVLARLAQCSSECHAAG